MAPERVKFGIDLLSVKSGEPLVINSLNDIDSKSMYLPIQDIQQLEPGQAVALSYKMDQDIFFSYSLKSHSQVRLHTNLPRHFTVEVFIRDKQSERAKMIQREISYGKGGESNGLNAYRNINPYPCMLINI